MKELLVPAGNMECLYQAINNGCDAVYISGKRFGARKYAENFTEDELVSAIKMCHFYGVKAYVTMNTLVKNSEVDSFIESVRFLYKNGVDALIMQDFGMICLVREMFPNLDIHASTQFNNSSKETCELLYKLGVKRVVFSRELSIDEIDNIDVPIEKETFIHGALCISYSGCCLMSSMLGGRSGNRGECVGSCRMPFSLAYNGEIIKSNQYLLSTKELNTSSNINRLLQSSIDSFKIEGRMKSPLYVGFITKFYRNLIDGTMNNYNQELDKLKTIYNREFTKGRLFFETDKDLINSKSPNHIGLTIGKCCVQKDKIKLILNKGRVLHQFDGIRFLNSNKGMIINYLYDSKGRLCNQATDVCYVDNKVGLNGDDILSKTQDYLLEKEFSDFNRKIKINFNVEAKLDKKLLITIDDGFNKITKEGSVVSKAIKAPTDKNTIEKHLNKLGNTPFRINNINILIDKDIFIQIKEINEIRRSLVSKLIYIRENKKIDFIENKVVFEKNNNIGEDNKKRISCLVFNEEQLNISLKNNVYRIYVIDKNLYNKYKEYKNVYYYVQRCSYNISHLLKEKNISSEIFDFSRWDVVGNYSLNVYNIYTAYYLKKIGLKNIPLSVELDEEEINEFIELYKNKFGEDSFEILSYGRVENMIIKGNILNLNKNDYNYQLIDIKNRVFNLYYDGIFTHIYNCEVRNLKNSNKNIINRLDFLFDSSDTVEKVCKDYLN